ncbi:MAG: DUF1330 domain-containing protein [Betaproteobacteria bacterium]|nr:DUF1330 domain-containing protein [Betaproteobacteria bacterium]
MAKAYWVVFYKAINDQEKFQGYAKVAPAAVGAFGGKFLVRGMPAKTYEHGMNQRVVVIEFESLEKAQAAHDSPAYQEALRILGDGVERDMRLVEGLA